MHQKVSLTFRQMYRCNSEEFTEEKNELFDAKSEGLVLGELKKAWSRPQSQSESASKNLLIGKNCVEVELRSFFYYCWKTMTTPLFILQYYMMTNSSLQFLSLAVVFYSIGLAAVAVGTGLEELERGDQTTENSAQNR